MKAREFIEIMHQAEHLKDTTRHSYTRLGRHESVAEHSWRISLMAYFLKDEFKDIDMNKVIQMCLIHDLGEVFTGDIATFNKTQEDENVEEQLLMNWVSSLPKPFNEEMKALYIEMAELKTFEAKLYKALDNLEALLQHNEASITTWNELEYTLNLHYGDDKVAFSDYLKTLREEIRKDSQAKIKEGK